MLGGEPGGLNEIRILRGELEETLDHVSKGADVVLLAGDRVEVRTPGGGGYGPGPEREKELVERDLRRGYVSSEQARKKYGYEV